MGLEKIVLLLDNKEVVVLNQNGTEYNRFKFDRYARDLFQHGPHIIANFCDSLAWHNYYGKKVCEETFPESTTSRTFNAMTHNQRGLYLVHSLLRAPNLDKDEPASHDIWLAHLDFEGRRKWYRKIKEKATELSKPLTNDKNIVVPYLKSITANSHITGFQIFDLEGNLVRDVERINIAPYPIAFVDNLFVYPTCCTFNKAHEPEDTYLETYNITELRKEFSINTNNKSFLSFHNANQVGCLSLGKKLYFRTFNTPRDSTGKAKGYIGVLDLTTTKMHYHEIPVYDMTALGNRLIVDKADPAYLGTQLWNQVGLGEIVAFGPDMQQEWIYKLPAWTRDTQHGFYIYHDGILITDKDSLTMIDLAGQDKWLIQKRAHLRQVAQPVG